MKHYYYYIVCGGLVTAHSQFYKVLLGQDVQAQRDLLFLQRYAAGNGHFFAMDAPDVSAFILRTLASVALDYNAIFVTTGRDLVRLFRHGVAIPSNMNAKVARIHQVKTLSLSCRVSSAVNRRRAG